MDILQINKSVRLLTQNLQSKNGKRIFQPTDSDQ